MKKVALFCGGFSSEYEISLKSAETISKNFPEGYDIFKVLVTRDSWWVEYQDQKFDFRLKDLSFPFEGKRISPDFGLVYIHGEPGENGKVQALMDMLKIPYLNSSVLASALTFDKWYCNQFLKQFDIPVAKSVFLRQNKNIDYNKIIEELSLPVFVKPSDSGSSYGISKVKVLEDLRPAIDMAFKEGRTVVVESFLDGIEVTCGVYRNQKEIHALPLTEIASENEFFDYAAKYDGKSKEITPARVSDSVRDKVQEMAKEIYALMQLKSIARIDFMLVNNSPFVIEVNTTPGFSPASIVPQMIKADGLTLQEFWVEILEAEGF